MRGGPRRGGVGRVPSAAALGAAALGSPLDQAGCCATRGAWPLALPGPGHTWMGGHSDCGDWSEGFGGRGQSREGHPVEPRVGWWIVGMARVGSCRQRPLKWGSSPPPFGCIAVLTLPACTPLAASSLVVAVRLCTCVLVWQQSANPLCGHWTPPQGTAQDTTEREVRRRQDGSLPSQ